ncbi:hypothetical protein ACLMJK_002153 [Lecanora helva]
MPAHNIPGYYFDEAKLKYFKILPNHVAPQGSKYSRGALQKASEEEAARDRLKAYEQTVFKQKIQRSKVLTHVLIGDIGLGREIRVTKVGQPVTPKAWAQGLERMNTWERMYHSLFEFDDATEALILASAADSDTVEPTYSVRLSTFPEKDEPDDLYSSATIYMSWSRISSLALSKSRVLMITSLGGSQQAQVQLTRLKPPDLFVYNENDPDWFESNMSILIRSSNPDLETFWSSSPRPLCHRSDFAIGTSSGITLIAEQEATWLLESEMNFNRIRYPRQHSRRQYLPVDVFALDWLSGNVVMGGSRDGSVTLWDVRSSSYTGGTSTPVLHPSVINHIRRLNDNKVLVAGIENKMAIYDMRYLKEGTEESCGAALATRPYMTFPTYRNKEGKGGLDVLGDTLVAFGADDGMVQIFDVGDGKEVPSGIDGSLRKKNTWASTLKFVEGREGVRLLVSAGKGIEEWGW